MKKLILILLTTLSFNVSLAQCSADFTYSVNPLNPLELTFTENSSFPTGSFSFTYEWYVFNTLTSTVNPAVITFTGSGTYKIKFYTKACLPIGGVFCDDDTIKYITVTDNISTGIKSFNKLNTDLVAYPNPTSGIVNLKLNESDLEKKYSVVNMMGQIILVGEFKDLNEKIDLSVLSSGIYILTSEKKTVKIMKN